MVNYSGFRLIRLWFIRNSGLSEKYIGRLKLPISFFERVPFRHDGGVPEKNGTQFCRKKTEKTEFFMTKKRKKNGNSYIISD